LTFAIQRKKQGYTRQIAIGRGVVQITGAIRRVRAQHDPRAGTRRLKTIKAAFARDGKFTSNAG